MHKYRILSFGKCEWLPEPIVSDETFASIYGARSALAAALRNGQPRSVHQGVRFEMLNHTGETGQITGVYWAVYPSVDGFSPLGEVFLTEEEPC